MSDAAADRYPASLQFAVYAIAFFAGSPFIMLSVIMPLWALQLSPSPLVIGLIISSRQILVIAMAVHGGALLDRFGPRVMIILTSVVGACIMALFPFFPIIAAVIVLQMISGFCETTAWIGSQALVGRVLGGRPVYAGRLTASARVGSFIGPWLMGLAWQFLGPAAAFWLMALWVLLGGVSALLLPSIAGTGGAKPKPAEPEPERAAETQPEPAAEEKAGRGVMPSVADYATTFRLLVLPAVALVIGVTFMRQTGSGVQSSFYGVWLKEIGYQAGTIGLLLGTANAASAVSALTIGPLSRRFSEHWLLIWATVLAIAAIAVTPLLDGFLILAFAVSLRGIGQGLNFPLMLAIASRAVGADLQGRVVALRITFNRLGGALVPFAMGVLAEFIGLEASFYVIGISGVLLLGVLGLWISRTPEFKAAPRW